MEISQTLSCKLRPVTTEDASLLNALSKKEKYRKVLGSDFKENSNCARAYARNKELYPLASIIYSKDTENLIGFLLLEDAGKGNVEASIIIDEGSERAYIEVLLATVEECKKANVKKIFFTPSKAVHKRIANLKKLSGALVAPIGTELSPEYEIVL